MQVARLHVMWQHNLHNLPSKSLLFICLFLLFFLSVCTGWVRGNEWMNNLLWCWLWRMYCTNLHYLWVNVKPGVPSQFIWCLLLVKNKIDIYLGHTEYTISLPSFWYVSETLILIWLSSVFLVCLIMISACCVIWYVVVDIDKMKNSIYICFNNYAFIHYFMVSAI